VHNESGGGAMDKNYKVKPHVCLNVFPYWYAMKDAWIYPEKEMYANGKK